MQNSKKSLFLALILCWSTLISAGQTARLIKFTQSPSGVVAAWRQKTAGVDTGPDSWERLSTTTGLNLVARGAALAKPVSRAFPAANSTLDFGLYKPMSDWPNGFIPVSFYTRTDVPLATQLRYSKLLEAGQGWTGTEQSDPTLKNRQYYDVPGSVLGPYESAPAFADVPIQTLLNQVAATFNGNCVGAARVVFNFEASYLPAQVLYWNNNVSEWGQRGVLQHYPDAETRQWVCETPALLGQTKTLRWLWDNNYFNAEQQQRQANRHVAILKWYKAKCGAGTLVCNGDGNQVFFNGNVNFIDDYAALKASSPVGYTPALFNTPANFGATTAGGVTVSGGGSRFWDVQDWVNNYHYVGMGTLPAADWDELAANKRTYQWFWDRVEPGASSDDINIPASTVLNRIFATRYGRPNLPIVWQGHNRFEFGAKKKGTEVSATFFNENATGPGLGGDGAIIPAYLQETYAIVQAMAATNPGDGLTMWTTHKRVGPGATAQANNWSNRPLHDWMGLYAGYARLYQFREYFDPANSPKFFSLDDVYVKYTGAYSGGSWGPSNAKTDGGDGYWKRGAGLISNHQNPEDPRTKTGVMARVILKNGVRWALFTATNHRHGRNDLSTFNVRFKAADIGTTSDIDVTGLSVTGWYATVVEVCLEPAKLTVPTVAQVTNGTTTSGGSGSVASGDKFFGFTFQPLPETARPANGEVTVSNGRIKVIRHLDYGGAITHVSENGGANYVNNFDKGRQIPVTIYSGPHPFHPQPTSTFYKPQPPHDFYNFGYNPIEAGNWINQGSPVTNYGYDASTQTHYIRCRGRNFPTANFLTGTYFEKWMRPVAPNIVRNWYKITWDRANDDVPVLERYPAEPNEEPILYGNLAACYKTAFAGANNSLVIRDLRTYGYYTATLASEPWFGAFRDEGSTLRGIGITGPAVWNIQSELHYNYSPGSVGEFSGDALYVANLTPKNHNPNGVMYLMFDVVVGTVDEVRAAAQLHPSANPANNAPDYAFTGATFHGFRAFNGLINSPGSGALVVDLLRNNVNVLCSATLFRASDVPTLYVRVKNELDADGLVLKWGKPGQNDTQASGQEVTFTCPRNGQYNTIAIPLTNVANWNGLISTISIGRARIGQENTETNVEGLGRKLSFSYIGKNNPN